MIENPVRRPMVHPIRLSWASSLIFFSLAISSKVVVSKRSPEEQILHDKDPGNTFCIDLQFELGCENCLATLVALHFTPATHSMGCGL